MGIKLEIDSLTIDGSTNFFFTNNADDSKIVVSDVNGFASYTNATLSTGDENFTVDVSVFSVNDSYYSAILKNRNYIIKANYNFSNASELIVFIENTLQSTTIGDKLRITNLTEGGNPVAISALILNNNTPINSNRWLVTQTPYYPTVSPDQDPYTGYNLSFTDIRGIGNEFTLLYSPTGMCKNGVRLTFTLGSFQYQNTFTSTDYIWYQTKRDPNYMEHFISTGTPPAPTIIDPGTGGGGPGGPGTGGGGF